MPLRKNFASERVAVAYSTSLEQFFHLYRVIKLRLIFMKVVANSCNSSRRQRFVREVCQKFVKMELVKTFLKNSLNAAANESSQLHPRELSGPDAAD